MRMRSTGRAATPRGCWRGVTTFLLMCVACSIGTSRAAEETRVLQVTGLRIEAEGPARATIVVSADGALSDYESFALPDPPRLVIDLPNARHAIPQPVSLPGGSPILKVRTSQYREGPIPVVRLLFDLGRALPYQLEVTGNKMEILMSEEPSGGASGAQQAGHDEKPVAAGERTESKSPVESAPVAAAAPPAGERAAPSPELVAPPPVRDEASTEKKEGAKPQEATSREPEKRLQAIAEPSAQPMKSEELATPSPPPQKPRETKSPPVGAVVRPGAPLIPRIARVTGLEVQAGGPTGATIVVSADGALSDYKSFTFPDPPRLVIDLPHARHAIPRAVRLPSASPILKVRATQYREKPVPVVRLVFELKVGLAFEAEATEKSLRIVLGEPVKASVAPSAIAVAPTSEVATKPPSVSPRRPVPAPVVTRGAKLEKKSLPPKETPTPAEIPVPSAPTEPQPAAAPAQAASPLGKGRLSLDFKHADLDVLLGLISEISGLNIVAAHGLQDRKSRDVTVRLINVEWRHALDLILRTKDLSYEQDGNVIFVGTKADIHKAKVDRAEDIRKAEETRQKIEEARRKAEQEAEEAKRKAEEEKLKAEQEAKLREIQIEEAKRKAEENRKLLAEPLKAMEIRLNYTKAADIRKRVEPLKTVRGRLEIDESLNALIMEDAESAVSRMEATAKRFDFPANEPVVTKMVSLNYARAADVANLLEPYRTNRGRLIPDDGRNTLLIEDFQTPVSKMEGLVKGFDIPANEPILTKTTTLNFGKAADVARRLEPFKTPRGKVIVNEQANSIIIEDFQSAATKMEAFAKQLDKPEVDRFVTKILRFNYAKAADLKMNLLTLKTPQGTVVVDERSSSIIIKDLPQAVERMETFLKQIDIATPQVLIEARIVEASRSFSQSLGVQWGGMGVPTKPGQTTGVTAFGGGGNPAGIQFPTPTVGNPPFLDPTNTIPFIGPVPLAMNLPAIASGANPFVLGATIGSLANRYLVGLQLSAAEREGRIRTLSSPRVATQDNEEAEIKQGSQVPFTTIDSSGRTVVSFQDAFIKLKVKPHITPDGRVSMKVEAERSFAADRIDYSGGFAFPINTRKATTNVLVPNGSTVVIGGLLQSTEQITTDQVPLMGRIPILGWLFKRQSIGPEERVELLIFLTPSVLQETKL